MGRIRPNFIKRLAKEIVKKHSDELTNDFYKNREFLEEILEFPNHRLRNKVTGYVTSLMGKFTPTN
ncbi:MAG: 30S ribosomal protein S17e [Candidatus Methanofastidiosia archaeon]